MRRDGRQPDQLRPVKITRRFTHTAPGSVLIQFGGTTVLCTASVDPKVPDWMAGKGRGWLTAECNMLPGSTAPRKKRERDGKTDGRTTEIQRLIGRSLRAIIDLDAIGERTLAIDCDVLDADGGTRTASITGAYVALVDAVSTIELPDPSRRALTDSVAAISVGIANGLPLIDLDYSEDVDAEVDMNVVMTGAGQFIEVQGTGEEATFSEAELHTLLGLARRGVQKLTELQQRALQ
ncbi:MAG: ribonuclease PH [Pirellulales bacterium]|nr:ribonuclease PH [Pirellulales bacterium]